MAGANGRDDPGLSALLTAAPYRFELRQAVRLLEQWAAGSVPLGAGSDPRREAVSLRGSLSGRFPSSGIEALLPGEVAQGPAITVAGFGLGGAFGPLPTPLTSLVLERLRLRDPAARDFLDLFNHRLLSLLLRQARLFAPVLQTGSWVPVRTPPSALLGLATVPAASSTPTPPLAAAGLLHKRPVSTHVLARLLAARLEEAVTPRPFRGGWLDLAADQQTRLGHNRSTQAGPPLGRGAVLGRRAWDQARGLRLDIGPLALAPFMSLLPGGAAHADILGLTRFTLGDTQDLELHLSLRAGDVPTSQLRAAPGVGGPRLGWTAWLGRRPRLAPGTVRLTLAGG